MVSHCWLPVVSVDVPASVTPPVYVDVAPVMRMSTRSSPRLPPPLMAESTVNALFAPPAAPVSVDAVEITRSWPAPSVMPVPSVTVAPVSERPAAPIDAWVLMATLASSMTVRPASVPSANARVVVAVEPLAAPMTRSPVPDTVPLKVRSPLPAPDVKTSARSPAVVPVTIAPPYVAASAPEYVSDVLSAIVSEPRLLSHAAFVVVTVDSLPAAPASVMPPMYVEVVPPTVMSMPVSVMSPPPLMPPLTLKAVRPGPLPVSVEVPLRSNAWPAPSVSAVPAVTVALLNVKPCVPIEFCVLMLADALSMTVLPSKLPLANDRFTVPEPPAVVTTRSPVPLMSPVSVSEPAPESAIAEAVPPSTETPAAEVIEDAPEYVSVAALPEVHAPPSCSSTMLLSQRSSSTTRRPPWIAESVPPAPLVPKPVRNELVPSCRVPFTTPTFASPVAVPVPTLGAMTRDPPFRSKMAGTLLMLHSPL